MKNKTKYYISFFGFFVVATFTTLSFLSLQNSNLILNPTTNGKNSRLANPSNPNIVTKTYDLLQLNADLYRFDDNFELATYYSFPQGGKMGLVPLIQNVQQLEVYPRPVGGALNATVAFNQLQSTNSISQQLIGANWSNDGTTTDGSDPSIPGNSLQIKILNAKADLTTGEYSGEGPNFFDSTLPNNALIYERTTQKAPPYYDDVILDPNNDPNVTQDSSNKWWIFKRPSNVSFPETINMENSPMLLNIGYKTTNMVDGQSSKYDYYPCIASNVNQSTSSIFTLSNDTNASNYGFYFDAQNNYAYFSGVFDALPNSLKTLNKKKFGLYTTTSQTNISRFDISPYFTSDPSILPSTFINNLPSDFFNPSNFIYEASNAIPSTFYGSQLELTANDLTGQITYRLIPGIGIKRERFDNCFKYDLVAPIGTNDLTKYQNGWKQVEDTEVFNFYEVSQGDALYDIAKYAQIAINYQDKIKDIVYEKLITGHLPTNFDKYTNIKIEDLNFVNKTGTLTFTLYLNCFFRNSEIVTDETNFGTITITGFKQITAATELVMSEITIAGDPVLSSWLAQENLQNVIVNIINENEAIANLPDTAQINIDIEQISKVDHPPQVTIPIFVTERYIYDENRDDFLFQYVENSSTSEPILGFLINNITFIGFKDVYPTTINIPQFELNNNQQQYTSQFTIDDAKQLVFENVEHFPEGFSKDNIIIDPFIQDHRNGTVTFGVKLNYYYNNNLELVENYTNFSRRDYTITNFIQSPGETRYNSRYVDKIWESLTVNEYTDQQVQSYIESKFINIPQSFPQPIFTWNEINRQSELGKIVVSGSLNKYFAAPDGAFKDATTGDEALVFNIELLGFFPAVTTSLASTELNVSLLDVSPSNVSQLTLKNKLLNSIIGKPYGFSIDNIIFDSYHPDNLQGKVTTHIKLNLWYDQDGQKHTTEEDFGEFVFTGLKAVQPTVFSDSGWDVAGGGAVASFVAQNRFQLLAIIETGILGSKPNGWNPENDIIICDASGNETSNINYNNLTGTIDLYVKLNRYYDAQGFLQTSWDQPPVHLVIGGFRILSPTTVVETFNVPNMGEQLASNYDTITKVKSIIKNYQTNIIANPSPTFDIDSDMDLTFDTQMYNPNPNNRYGKIVLNYAITNYYNENGLIESNSTNPLTGTLVLEGFKNIEPTTVNEHVVVENYQNIVGSTMNGGQLQALVNNNIRKFFNYYPTTISVVRVEIVEANNLQGVLKIRIFYGNYYDENGNFVADITSKIVEVSGFKHVTATTISPTINSPTTINFYPNEIYENKYQLLDILLEPDIFKLFVNEVPNNFAQKDIINIEMINFDNIQGSVVFNVDIVNYYNANGDVELYEPLSQTITMSNFLTHTPTWFDDEILLSSNNEISQLLPSEVSIDQLIDFVWDNIRNLTQNLPLDFKKSDIRSIRKESANNLTGNLVIMISITNYYDQEAVLQQTTLKNDWVLTISNFRNIIPTSVVSTLSLKDVNTMLPSSLTRGAISNIIVANKNYVFSSLPDDFSAQNIIINDWVANDINGTIEVEISLTLYYDAQGNINTTQPLDATIQLQGFDRISPTIVENDFVIPNVSNIIASEYDIQNLYSVIEYNLPNIIHPLPNDFRVSTDIKEIKPLRYDNENGIINVEITFTNYYDSVNGTIVKDATRSDTINFRGFKPIAGGTTVVNRFTSDAFTNLLATEFNNSDIRRIVELNTQQIFNNLPNDFSSNNIISVAIDEQRNLDGEMDVIINLNKYFDDKGVLQNNFKTFRTTFYGFLTAPITQFNKDVLLDNVYDTIASSVEIDELQSLIFNNLSLFVVNPGPNFNISNIIVDEIINVFNQEGKIVASVSYTNWYDETGNLNLETPHQEVITINGFKQEARITDVRQEKYILNGYENITAQDISNEISRVKEIIYSNRNFIFVSLPEDINYDQLVIKKINFNNLDGELSVLVELSKYYNSDSILVDDVNDPKTFTIKLGGFLPVSATQQINEVIALENVNNILPTEMNDLTNLKNLIWINKNEIFNSLPTSFSIDNINIEILKQDNLKGEIKLKIYINKYYDENGDEQNLLKTFDLTFTNFKSINQTTVINNNINVIFPDDIDTNAYNVQNITINQLKTLIYYNKYQIFSNLPGSFSESSIQSIQVLHRDAINGQIIVSFSYLNYYDRNGNININQLMSVDSLTLKGFNQNVSTTIVSSLSVADTCSNNFASEYQLTLFDNLNQIIKDKREELFANTLPPNAEISLVSVDSYNNWNGTASVTITVNMYYDESGLLYKHSKNFHVTLTGFKILVSSSTIAGQQLPSQNQNSQLSINVSDLGSTWYKTFSNLLPSNIEKSQNDWFITTLQSALTTSLAQNGDDSIGDEIKLENLKYKPGSANDINGSIVVFAQISNFWDSNGVFHTNPVLFEITLTGFKSIPVISSSNVTQIIFLVLIIIAALIVCLLVALAIAKLPKILKK